MTENAALNNTPKKTGGLYAKVKMSVRSANIMVAVLSIVLIAATVFIVRHSGFTVKFETDGGSVVESVRLKYSDTVPFEQDPVKEGFKFAGWYKDSACTERWEDTDTVSGSMTLYAKWIEK